MFSKVLQLTLCTRANIISFPEHECHEKSPVLVVNTFLWLHKGQSPFYMNSINQ